MSTILRFRIAAFLLLAMYLFAIAAVIVLAHSLVIDDRLETTIAIGLGILALLASAFQWVLARRTNCPLCMTPVLATKHCSKHRKARKLLGSYRLRAAVSVIFRGTFSCPYCHEKSELKVRGHHH